MSSGIVQPMSPEPSLTADVLVTREVRWFRPGSIPANVLDWFTASSTLGVIEHRVDHYDLASTRPSVGLKQRNAESIDAKFLMDATDGVDLGPRLRGRVEDWLKISSPLEKPQLHLSENLLPVTKDLITRTYVAHLATAMTGRDMAACSVELGAIAAAETEMWSLCFETYGSPALLSEALQAGIDGLLRETPLPPDLRFGEADSYGYPEWIGRLASQQLKAGVA